MSIESRLARGESPEDIAQLLQVPVEQVERAQKAMAPKKKAAKKKAK